MSCFIKTIKETLRRVDASTGAEVIIATSTKSLTECLPKVAWIDMFKSNAVTERKKEKRNSS
jgi:hypothetical protein